MRTDGRRNSKPKVRGKKAGRKILRLAAVLLILAGAAFFVPRVARAAARYVCRMPFFTIKQVRVEGFKYVQKDDFIGFVGDPKGESILSYDMKGAMERIGGHPWIKSGLVRREFPDEVRFELTERIPAAVVQTGAGKYLMDAEGFALARVTQPGWEFLPVVRYPSSQGLRILDPKTAECLMNAFELLRVVRGSKGPLAYANVGVCKDGSPCILIRDAVVKVGLGGYPDKVQRLADVEADIVRRGLKAELIDLRFPGKVVVKEGQPSQSLQARAF
ncbi:MAG: FtsQ-type POTRA domain-containing protein [Nitrospirota bacterium]